MTKINGISNVHRNEIQTLLDKINTQLCIFNL